MTRVYEVEIINGADILVFSNLSLSVVNGLIIEGSCLNNLLPRNMTLNIVSKSGTSKRVETVIKTNSINRVAILNYLNEATK